MTRAAIASCYTSVLFLGALSTTALAKDVRSPAHGIIGHLGAALEYLDRALEASQRLEIRSLFGLLLSGAAASAQPPAESDSPAPVLTVRIYDYAGVAQSVLARGLEQARELIQSAGVRTTWVECRTSARQNVRDARCRDKADVSVLQLRILSPSMAAKIPGSSVQFGYSVPTDSGHGVIAAVFFHRVEALSVREGVDLDVLLAHVLAHEVGHLLLGAHSHARHGIMKGRWKGGELLRMCHGALRFTPKQERLMLENVESRHSLREHLALGEAGSRRP